MKKLKNTHIPTMARQLIKQALDTNLGRCYKTTLEVAWGFGIVFGGAFGGVIGLGACSYGNSTLQTTCYVGTGVCVGVTCGVAAATVWPVTLPATFVYLKMAQ